MAGDYSIVLSVVYGPLLQEILAQLDKNIEFQEEVGSIDTTYNLTFFSDHLFPSTVAKDVSVSKSSILTEKALLKTKFRLKFKY